MAAEHVIGIKDSDHLAGKADLKNGRDVMRKVNIRDYCSQKSVIFVEKNDSIVDAIRTLKENKLQSVPIRDASHRQTEWAFVDVLDILVHAKNVYSKWKQDSLKDDELEQLFKSISLKELSNISGRNPFSGIGVDTPTEAAVKKFVRWSAHRLPVIDSDGELYLILSQSSVLEFLNQHSSLFETSRKTVKEVELGIKNVATVDTSTPTIDGFRLLLDKKISGVPVLDESGNPVHVLTITDVKHLIQDGSVNFSLLDLSIGDFKKKELQSDQSLPQGLLSVGLDTTVGEVLKKFIDTRVHRLFVVSDGKVAGVVSPIDLMGLLVEKY